MSEQFVRRTRELLDRREALERLRSELEASAAQATSADAREMFRKRADSVIIEMAHNAEDLRRLVDANLGEG